MEIREVETDGTKTVIDLLEEGFKMSRNEARRLVKQGAVKWITK